MSYIYNSDLFTSEHEQFRSAIKRFIVQEIEPKLDEWNENHGTDPDFWRKAADIGMLCVDVPPEYGGGGGDFMHRIVLMQEIGYSPAGASIAGAIIGGFMSEQIAHWGTEEQKAAILPGMARGEIRTAFGMTEPDNGSDLASLRTTAVRDGDDFVINGAKTYISNSPNADFVMVACKTQPELGNRGISILVVEADRPGFRRGRKLKKMGMNGSETGELFFDNVRVPAKNLFGPENGGFKVMVSAVDDDRIVWPVLGHAAAQRAFDETVAFVKQRKAFGQTIFDFQNTQFKLAEMKTELAVGKAFLDECLRTRLKTGRLDSTMAAMAKLWVPEMEGRVIDQCVQLHGGAGYMDEYPVSRLYTAARVHRILGGTAEIMRLIIGRGI